MQSGQISVAVGGQPVVTAVDRSPLSAGIIGLGAIEGSGFAFDTVSLTSSGAVVETHAMHYEVQDPMVAQLGSGSSEQTTGGQTMELVTPIPAQQFPATTQAVPLPIRGNFDIYMKLGDIVGDATSDRHTSWTRVLDFSFSVGSSTSNESWTRRDHGTGTSTTAFGPLMIKKPFDIGSPEIYFTCALGSPINEVKLEVVDTAGLARMQLFLVNARIIGVETGTVDPSDPEEGVTETIALSFSKVKWVYREQGVGEIKRGWDLVANQQW